MTAPTLTRVEDMTDAELDHSLTRAFEQHYEAGPERRAVLHRVIADIIGEQHARLDAWLAAKTQSRGVISTHGAVVPPLV